MCTVFLLNMSEKIPRLYRVRFLFLYQFNDDQFDNHCQVLFILEASYFSAQLHSRSNDESIRFGQVIVTLKHYWYRLWQYVIEKFYS